MTDFHPGSFSASNGSARRQGPMLTLLAGWFAFVFTLAAAGSFERPPGEPPLPTMIAVTLPILGFFLLYATHSRFRQYILSLDLRFLTIVHAWRTVGFAFIVLHMRDALPGLFAWPAGLGDIAVAVTAPAITFALIKSPAFATSRRFIWWHVLGLVDFVVAVGTGVLSSGAFPALYQPAITTGPMGEMPLILIPAFFVPAFAITHFAALLKARHLRREHPGYAWDGVPGSA
jgi:hypothetical protein